MFDTHTHLQFKAFENNVDEVIKSAKDAGIKKIVVVGTNLETSGKAIKLSEKHEDIYTSVGIHPHHVFPYTASLRLPEEGRVGDEVDAAISSLKKLISNPKVIAIGETGLDRHIYENTKYKNYQITNKFLNLQKIFFEKQIQLAIEHKKTLIIHNREASDELLEILKENWHPFLEERSVFHCCEPNQKLLDFALKHKVFIGIDGDITYDKQKQEFLKKIPLERIVLETDSPYFLPEPFRHSEGSPVDFRVDGNPKSINSQASLINNEPKNITIVAEYAAQILNLKLKTYNKAVLKNSLTLFNLPKI